MSGHSVAEKREFARQLRNEPTRAEQELWLRLRHGQLGVRFQRQSLVAGYIVDFYCGAAKLAIEIDGSVHSLPSTASRDGDKEQNLETLGIQLLRFSNRSVLEYRSLVLGEIRAALKAVAPVTNRVIDISSSSSRACESVEASQNISRVINLPQKPKTGYRAANPALPVEIAPHFATLVTSVRQRSEEAFGIETWSPQTLAAKKQNAKAALAAWIAEHQMRLPMPSSVKKAVETANEALALTLRKGIDLA